MGNCLNRRSATWVDDDEDWECLEESKSSRKDEGKKRDEQLPSAAVVKIKITKKQLEEILRHAQEKGVAFEVVMSNLVMSASEKSVVGCRSRRWRPRLESIREVEE